MSSISSIGNQPPIPPSVNQNSNGFTGSTSSASNPLSDLNAQQNLAEANNAGTATSNAAAIGESAIQGILTNLNLTPRNQV